MPLAYSKDFVHIIYELQAHSKELTELIRGV